ncbi:Galactose-1-phosphate uridylyltransferase [Bacillus sp. cl95]|nr:Galactose-1-phosphate uridylyltransferase [Bacillus sp. UNCCL13]SFQ90330.1 Galactose-1-phosphate uridylyltransferase [Bacillus sp. cl95]
MQEISKLEQYLIQYTVEEGDAWVKKRHLQFNTTIGAKKPENIRNTQNPCPFCDRGSLTDFIDEDGSILLLKNKFPVLGNSYQTVLIETDDCKGEMSTYTKEHLYRLIQFGLKHWLAIEATGEYESVIFFKNHGPFSGGTLAHPHMQIIGLKDVDYHEHVMDEYFEGIEIYRNKGVTFSLSTKPRVGFYEFNVKLEDMSQVNDFADCLQVATHFILNGFSYSCTSYNIFFYHHREDIYAKIVPRFVTTPIYIGYSIPQVPNNLESMAEKVRQTYFTLSSENL